MMPSEKYLILLVEDNQDQTELALMALEQAGIRNPVDVVRDGVQALDYLSCRGAFAGRTSGNPALVLMDVHMPRMNGIAALRQIKQIEELRLIPVVMLTSSQLESERRESYDAGANAFVVKPVEFDSFVLSLSTTCKFWTQVNEPPPT